MIFKFIMSLLFINNIMSFRSLLLKGRVARWPSSTAHNLVNLHGLSSAIPKKATKRKPKTVAKSESVEVDIESSEIPISPAVRFPFTYQQVPDETLYIFDGTAMLFGAYFSQEHKHGYQDAYLSSELSSELCKTLPSAVIAELRTLYANQTAPTVKTIDFNEGIDEEIGIEISAADLSVTETSSTHSSLVETVSVSPSLLGTDLIAADTNQSLAIKCGALTTMVMHFARFIRDVKPKYVAMAFDAGKKTFRNEIFAPYKQQRLTVSTTLRFSFIVCSCSTLILGDFCIFLIFLI